MTVCQERRERYARLWALASCACPSVCEKPMRNTIEYRAAAGLSYDAWDTPQTASDKVPGLRAC